MRCLGTIHAEFELAGETIFSVPIWTIGLWNKFKSWWSCLFKLLYPQICIAFPLEILQSSYQLISLLDESGSGINSFGPPKGGKAGSDLYHLWRHSQRFCWSLGGYTTSHFAVMWVALYCNTYDNAQYLNNSNMVITALLCGSLQDYNVMVW